MRLKIPKLTSALLFKVPGGVSGEIGKKLARAKETERRLNIARTKANGEARDVTKKKTDNSDWSVAAGAPNLIKGNNYKLDGLKKPQLQSLVRALKVGKAVGSKGELQGLLVDKFGDLTAAQFSAIELAVQRGAALTLLPPAQGAGSGDPAPALTVVPPPPPVLVDGPVPQLL